MEAAADVDPVTTIIQGAYTVTVVDTGNGVFRASYKCNSHADSELTKENDCDGSNTSLGTSIALPSNKTSPAQTEIESATDVIDRDSPTELLDTERNRPCQDGTNTVDKHDKHERSQLSVALKTKRDCDSHEERRNSPRPGQRVTMVTKNVSSQKSNYQLQCRSEDCRKQFSIKIRSGNKYLSDFLENGILIQCTACGVVGLCAVTGGKGRGPGGVVGLCAVTGGEGLGPDGVVGLCAVTSGEGQGSGGDQPVFMCAVSHCSRYFVSVTGLSSHMTHVHGSMCPPMVGSSIDGYDAVNERVISGIPEHDYCTSYMQETRHTEDMKVVTNTEKTDRMELTEPDENSLLSLQATHHTEDIEIKVEADTEETDRMEITEPDRNNSPPQKTSWLRSKQRTSEKSHKRRSTTENSSKKTRNQSSEHARPTKRERSSVRSKSIAPSDSVPVNTNGGGDVKRPCTRYYIMTCGLCDAAYSYISKKKSAWRNSYEDNGIDILCSECKQVSNSPFALSSKRATADLASPLFICKETDCKAGPFKAMMELRKHVECHSTNPVTCSFCQLQVRNARKLAHHRSKCPGRKDQCFCDICGRPQNNRFHLVEHMRRAHPTTRKLCEDCGASFKSATSLVRHRQTHVPPADRPTDVQTCDICLKVFTSKANLLHHKTRTHREKTKECVQCSKLFKTTLQLNRHMLTHDTHKAQRKHGCALCPAKYIHRRELEEHVRRVHELVRDFCEICQKLFRSSLGYKQHMKAHSNPDSSEYMCSVCGKQYASTLGLKYHKDTICSPV